VDADAYYHLDLANCADAVAAAGSALHPGLRLARVAAATRARHCRVLLGGKRVLIQDPAGNVVELFEPEFRR
jgi:hypothetical protein